MQTALRKGAVFLFGLSRVAAGAIDVPTCPDRAMMTVKARAN